MRQSIKLVLLYLIIQLLVGAVVAGISVIISSLWKVNSLDCQSALLAPSLLISIGLMCLYMYETGYLPNGKKNWSFTSLGYLLLILLMGISTIVLVDWISSFLQMMPDWMNQTFATMQTGVLGIISIAIIGPVFEEILFRGTITRLLLDHYDPWKAILISALFFGIFHINPAQIIPAFLIGLLLAWLYSLTRSLIPGILIHVFNNSMSVFLTLHYPNAKTLRDIPGLSGYVILVICALLLFLLSGYLIYRRQVKADKL
jgi:membrane protease YdiL (CAAX protease family)